MLVGLVDSLISTSIYLATVAIQVTLGHAHFAQNHYLDSRLSGAKIANLFNQFNSNRLDIFTCWAVWEKWIGNFVDEIWGKMITNVSLYQSVVCICLSSIMLRYFTQVIYQFKLRSLWSRNIKGVHASLFASPISWRKRVKTVSLLYVYGPSIINRIFTSLQNIYLSSSPSQ